jgi:alpha-L-rhamnosidase
MSASQAPAALRVENHPVQDRVLGIGEETPRLSWQVPSAPHGWRQGAYEVEVSRGGSTEGVVVEGDAQLFVPWPVAPLAPREQASVRVRVRGGDDWSPWSAPLVVERGLTPADWRARFVGPAAGAGLEDAAPVLRGVWDLPEGVVTARLYVTAHGLYEARINGRRVGDHELAPGWTSYHHRLRYQTHDVTELLRAGGNDVEVLLGNGWWRGHLTWSMQRALYGDRLALLAQLEVVTADGARHVRTADGSWSAAPSRIAADDLYNGQTTDLRPGAEGRPGPVEEVAGDLSVLVAPDGPPVRVTDVLPAREVWRSPAGRLLVDFGQNVVGRVRLRVRGAAGQQVVVRHAEVLEHDELGTRPLRHARATDTYLLAGDGEEVLEPTFTFHGFRYAQVDGVDDLDPAQVEAVVLGSDLPRTGWFDSSHDLLNRFHENVVWGMRGNFVDVPTDCPQRDERLGWTGDIQVFAPTAQFLHDSTGFLRSWLQDVAADQAGSGSVPFVVPDVLRNGMTATAWGDAAVVVPWVLYERSGDAGVLARQLPSMRAWVDYVAARSGEDGVWAGDFQFGDWLDPTAPPEEAYRAKADPDVVATAYVVRSADLLLRAADVLGDPGTAEHARAVRDRALAGFRREFVTPAGRVLSDAQTAYALALCFDLLEDDAQRAHAAHRLADLVRTAGFRIATGFVGTPLVADALAEHGHLDLAYRLLLQTGCPSWLYSVAMGATTVWERWDSMLPDGTINPGEMTSFNHYALGAVADWLHRTVAGLAPAAPGYRRLRVAPRPGGGLTRASARHATPYGEAAVAWRIDGDALVVDAAVPVGTTAEVDLPGLRTEVGAGSHTWSVPWTPRAPGRPRTVRELMDDEPTWRRFHEAAVAAGLGGMVHLAGEADVADRMASALDQPVTVVLDLLTLGGADPGRERLEAELGDLVHD